VRRGCLATCVVGFAGEGIVPALRASRLTKERDVPDFLTILPMAVVMVTGPQIVSAVFLAIGD
jgi:hypothetical protein